MRDIEFAKPLLHVFVCINDRTCQPNTTMPSCGPTITPAMVKEVKQWVLTQGLVGKVYVSKASCLGFCTTEGGVACVYPTGRFVKGLTSVEDIRQLILEELSKLERLQE